MTTSHSRLATAKPSSAYSWTARPNLPTSAPPCSPTKSATLTAANALTAWRSRRRQESLTIPATPLTASSRPTSAAAHARRGAASLPDSHPPDNPSTEDAPARCTSSGRRRHAQDPMAGRVEPGGRTWRTPPNQSRRPAPTPSEATDAATRPRRLNVASPLEVDAGMVASGSWAVAPDQSWGWVQLGTPSGRVLKGLPDVPTRHELVVRDSRRRMG